MEDEIAAKNIKKGDIFFVKIDKKYFFMQVIKITKDLNPKNGINYKYGYFIIVFEKTFKELPNGIDQLELTKIYQPKHILKNTLLYASIWNKYPSISFDESLKHYEYKDKYKLTLFGNNSISENFEPNISYQFSMPAQCLHNIDNIQISHSPISIQLLLWIITEDQKKALERVDKTILLYFKEWIDYVYIDHIVKIEKIIMKLDNLLDIKYFEKELRKTVIAINKLDDKYNFITTIESEQIFEKLISISSKTKVKKVEIIKIIEENRNW